MSQEYIQQSKAFVLAGDANKKCLRFQYVLCDVKPSDSNSGHVLSVNNIYVWTIRKIATPIPTNTILHTRIMYSYAYTCMRAQIEAIKFMKSRVGN